VNVSEGVSVLIFVNAVFAQGIATLPPTASPTAVPSTSPTAAPSNAPTVAPSATPSATPTAAPTTAASVAGASGGGGDDDSSSGWLIYAIIGGVVCILILIGVIVFANKSDGGGGGGGSATSDRNAFANPICKLFLRTPIAVYTVRHSAQLSAALDFRAFSCAMGTDGCPNCMTQYSNTDAEEGDATGDNGYLDVTTNDRE
jgi:hypothetical protein